MQSDDLGLRNKAVDQLTAEDRLRLHVHDDQTFAFTLDDAENLVPEIDVLRAELAAKDAAIERLVAERDEAQRRIELLTAGINGVVNFQSPLTRAQVREAMSDLLESTGSRPWTTEDQSPFAARAGRLAEALKAIRGGVRADGHVWIDCGNGGLESGPTVGEFIDQAMKDAP